MKRYRFSWILILLALVLTMATACNNDDEFLSVESGNVADTARVVHTAKMRLWGDRAAFAGEGDEDGRDSRAVSSEWKDGDKLYLQFSVGSQRVDGAAVYKAATDEWEVQYYGTISSGEKLSCEVYYFEGAESATTSKVTLASTTAVYADTSATYLLQDGTVTVTAHLTPLTGRLRFKGESGTAYTTYGFQYYTEYDITHNTFVKSDAFISSTIGGDGYTPYYYGEFADASNKVIYVKGKNGNDLLRFFRTLPSTALSPGHSGWLNLPTYTSRNGWKMEEIPTKVSYTVGSVTFNMILVEGGTFTMGATAEQTGAASNESPAHQVTLSDYYIGETEVTQALWKVITGYSPFPDPDGDIWRWTEDIGLGDTYPAYWISYEDVQNFITMLNVQTGVTFRMPTEAEWEYAARGGNQSKGYLYSGSNTIGNVAWYTPNSDHTAHPVATKAANELGIYDMSGNLWEWCSDWYSSDYYSTSPQFNPTGPATGSYRVLRGGSWVSDAAYCRVASRDDDSPSGRYGNGGCRLAFSSF